MKLEISTTSLKANLPTLRGLVDRQKTKAALLLIDELASYFPTQTSALAGYKGYVFTQAGQLEAAEKHFRDALEIDRDDRTARVNLALHLLRLGQFEEGWKHYGFRDLDAFHSLPMRLWKGEKDAIEHLYLFPEQGLGDQIFFSSCLRELSESGIAKRYTLICHSKLDPLYRHSFPQFNVVCLRNGSLPEKPEPNSSKTAMGYLPSIFPTLPKPKGFLRAPVGNKMVNYAGEKPLVGISWKGGSTPTEQNRRSLSLEQLLPILSLPDLQFVSLQRKAQDEGLAELRHRFGQELLTVEQEDDNLDQTAGALAECDLVLSIDNTTAHLAGAMGKPTWVLLPFMPDWRWGLNTDSSPWYPTAKLFRQERPGDWTKILKTIEGRLTKVATELRTAR